MGSFTDDKSASIAMKWAKPVSHRVYEIGRNLREADRKEVWLSHRLTGLDAVLTSWHQSDLCRCIETDAGEPVGITGLVKNRIWMLGTDNLVATRERRLQLCKEGRLWVDQHPSLNGQKK